MTHDVKELRFQAVLQRMEDSYETEMNSLVDMQTQIAKEMRLLLDNRHQRCVMYDV